MDNHRILPFYMTYPLPLFYQEEDKVQRDLEYLQQMYPTEAKRYQRIIVSMLDKIDYEGSMIYDEYPDRMRLYSLAQDIVNQIKREESMERNNAMNSNRMLNRNPMSNMGNMDGMNPMNNVGNMDNMNPMDDWDNPERWEHLSNLIQILLFYEIYKRRHTNRRGILKF